MKTMRVYIATALIFLTLGAVFPRWERKASANPVKCAILFLVAPIELWEAVEKAEEAQKICKAKGLNNLDCIKAIGIATLAAAKAALTNLELYCECLGGANMSPKLCAIIGVIPNPHGNPGAAPPAPALPKPIKPVAAPVAK